MEIKIPEKFESILDNENRYLIMVGSAGSGKSEFSGRKIFYRCMKEGNHRFLIMRKVRTTLRESVIKLMLELLDSTKNLYIFNKTERFITLYNPQGIKSEILFEGLDDPEKIKSIKGITGIWIEEMTEFTRQDVMQIDLRLRGKTKYYKQIMCSFNPIESAAPWIKEDFFDNKKEDSYVHHSTIDDNPFIDKGYFNVVDRINDPVYHKIYRLGQWAVARGIIYENWDILDKFPKEFDEVIWGLDFGFNNPSALVKIGYKDNEIYIEEKLYKKGLTNNDLIQEMENMINNKNDEIYADSAEPARIEEIGRAGFNIKPSDKSVKDGIDRVKTYKLHIHKESNNLQNEVKVYKWKEDKNGNPLDEPVKFQDHLNDAFRYGIYTHYLENIGGSEPYVWSI